MDEGSNPTLSEVSENIKCEKSARVRNECSANANFMYTIFVLIEMNSNKVD